MATIPNSSFLIPNLKITVRMAAIPNFSFLIPHLLKNNFLSKSSRPIRFSS